MFDFWHFYTPRFKRKPLEPQSWYFGPQQWYWRKMMDKYERDLSHEEAKAIQVANADFTALAANLTREDTK